MRNMGRNGEGGVPSSAAVHNAAAAIPSAVVATCSAICRQIGQHSMAASSDRLEISTKLEQDGRHGWLGLRSSPDMTSVARCGIHSHIAPTFALMYFDTAEYSFLEWREGS